MSNLVDYAKDELKRIGMIDSGDPYNEWATKAILDLIELFASQGHSDLTAPYVASMFYRLAMFKPASPLTGEDDEWKEVDTGVFQNKRYSSVFKDKDGTVYDIEGKVFTDDGEIWYTCKDSMVNVTFPYVVPKEPERVYRNKKVEDDLAKLPRNLTAPYVASMFYRLAMFKPASPLTGEDDEWKEVDTGVFQNKRYSSVFKDKDGTVYDLWLQ